VLLGILAASVWLGALAQRAVDRGGFREGFFLGNRGLGAWTLALTATVQSGGTFLGFPSYVYSHGWIVALWIAGYMAVPICGFGVLAKRLALLSRRTGSVTVPDIFRERFGSPMLGLVSSLLIIFLMAFMLVANFKGGAIILQSAWAGDATLTGGGDRTAFLIGLAAFAVVVVGYTLIGGFLAAVWTDLFQSVLMLAGVLILLPLALYQAGGLERASAAAVAQTGPAFEGFPGWSADGRQFLPVSLAFSFFFVWVFAAIGSPASMSRYMACRNTEVIRKSVVLFGSYNLLLYLPLILICIAARGIFDPALPDDRTDMVMPLLAMRTTRDLPGGSLLAGLILAAPFGAVMATVSCYLVVIGSGLVNDVYLRLIRPQADEREIKLVTRLTIFGAGLVATLANLVPIGKLQAIVVFNNSSQAASFVIPAVMLAFWKRATTAGTLAAMLGGFAVTLGLFAAGWIQAALGIDQRIGPKSDFRPWYLLGLDPIVWGLLASLTAGILVSLMTRPPEEERLRRCFD
jgi:SSS family solute:Na+ symporter/sodium/pantothenate symporter